jgi:hypothetical protein
MPERITGALVVSRAIITQRRSQQYKVLKTHESSSVCYVAFSLNLSMIKDFRA